MPRPESRFNQPVSAGTWKPISYTLSFGGKERMNSAAPLIAYLMITVPICVISAAVTVSKLGYANVGIWVSSSSMSKTRIGGTKRCGRVNAVGDDGRTR